jgi:hypothetical protein
MKGKTVLTGILGITLTFVFLLTGCPTTESGDGDGGGGGGDDIAKELQGEWYNDNVNPPALVYKFTKKEMSYYNATYSAKTSKDELTYSANGVKYTLTWKIVGDKLYITEGGQEEGPFVKAK